jgi:hypothetical protein
MFVNMYSKGAVAVVDREKRTVIATWPITSEGRNIGPMAFDEADHRLFVFAYDPGKVVIIDSFRSARGSAQRVQVLSQAMRQV